MSLPARSLASLAALSLACSAPPPGAPTSAAPTAPAASSSGPAGKRIGILSGHGEDSLSTPLRLEERVTARDEMARALPGHRFEDVDLRQGAEIDAGLGALLITQPATAYTEDERRRIDAFLLRGNKGMAVFASAAHLRPGDPRFLATVAPTGLEPLLAAYGVDVHTDVVSDDKAGLRIPVPRPNGSTGWLRMTSLFISSSTAGTTLDRTFSPFAVEGELPFPFASSLAIAPHRQPGCTVTVRARTSAWSWLTSDAQQDLGVHLASEPPPDLEAASIAASVEGRLTSGFSGATSPGRTRLLVVASGQFVLNPFVRHGQAAEGAGGAQGGDAALRQLATPYAQKYAAATRLVLRNTLDWVTGADAP